MSGDLTVEIVDSSIDGSADTSNSSGDSEPTLLMRGGSGKTVEAEEYPEVTTNINIDAPDTVEDVVKQNFKVSEEDDERDVLSLEFIDEPLDIVFVFDDTGSMSNEIEGAKQGVTDLIKAIDAKNIDSRYGLVTFKNDSESVEVDCRLDSNPRRIESTVDELVAQSGGPTPEANFDAIERALDLRWRTKARQVIVDITDAPSHYRGDDSGASEYTFSEVADDLESSDVTFISVAPDKKNREDSIKSLTAEVDGLWTDISNVRSGGYSTSSGGSFEMVLDRISSLLASTYVLTHFSCAPPGEETELRVEFDHPSGRGSDTAMLKVPDRFELPPECPEAEGTPMTETDGDVGKTSKISRDSSGATGVTRSNQCPECGTRNDPGTTFCKECGQKID